MPSIISMLVYVSLSNGDKREIYITTMCPEFTKSANKISFKLSDYPNATPDIYPKIIGDKLFKYLEGQINVALSQEYNMEDVVELALINIEELDFMNTCVIQNKLLTLPAVVEPKVAEEVPDEASSEEVLESKKEEA